MVSKIQKGILNGRIPFQIFEVRTALIWGTAAYEPKKNWSDKKITELSQIFEHPIARKQ